jgi:uncharacterized protein (TIGR04255 family)
MQKIKLKDDAILEALLELRFSFQELDELIVAKLSDLPEASTLKKTRLPPGEIPQALRASNPMLQHQPLLEIGDGDRRVRVGPAVLSAHRVGRYPGWDVFGPELESLTNHLFSKLPGVLVTRIGLRYITALVPERHKIDSIRALRLKVEVADKPVTPPLNVNFITYPDATHAVATRIASPEFIAGSNTMDARVFVDIEASTPNTFSVSESGPVISWLSKARDLKNDAFLSLFPPAILSELLEK